MNLVDPTKGLIDRPCAGCGSTTFYVGALSLLCCLCIDRVARMNTVKRDGPMTPRTTTTTQEDEEES